MKCLTVAIVYLFGFISAAPISYVLMHEVVSRAQAPEHEWLEGYEEAAIEAYPVVAATGPTPAPKRDYSPAVDDTMQVDAGDPNLCHEKSRPPSYHLATVWLPDFQRFCADADADIRQYAFELGWCLHPSNRSKIGFKQTYRNCNAFARRGE